MIEYFYKHGGKHVVGEAKNYIELKSKVKSKDFLCFLVQCPDDSEIEGICKDHRLDTKPFRKFKGETRSLRYSFDPLIFTFTDYYTINEHIKISHLLFVVKDNLLILVSSDTSPYYKDLFRKILEKSQSRKKSSSGYILYEFLHQDAKENYDVLESMDDKIANLEKRVLEDNHEKNLTHDILTLKKELIQMSKRLWASSKVIFTIRKDLSSIHLNKEEVSLLDDIYDTFLHQIDLIETQKETVTDYLEIFTTIISNRLAATSNELNIVMKKMAALTIIIMVPTLIAGIYGMNYHYMPELSWKFGYAFALILMLVAAWFTYSVFHRKKWI
jgi:magnesium transporter